MELVTALKISSNLMTRSRFSRKNKWNARARVK